MSNLRILAVLIAALGAAMARGAGAAKPGDKMFREYIEQEALRLDGGFLAGIRSPGDWQKRREEYRRRFLYMMGLWPLPERTPLVPVVTGTLVRDDFVVEKLHFQSRPHLYVTANLYRPRTIGRRLPSVLYVCGHAGRGRDGNKTAYQHHAIWFATHGYVCLVIDSLQLGEIGATHHGTYRYNRWWWHSRGYTPAGVETWNCIRALDYLQTRPEVDTSRFAVTGRSGGGAYSFWLAAADDRCFAMVPVSGMSDLEDYVKPPVINGHCDCMFLYNTYQWPWTRIAALAAPRPVLFGNSSKDRIFPMTGNDRIIKRLRRLYELLGHPERVDAFVAPGGHSDSPPLRLAAFRWINRFLKGDDSPVAEPEGTPKIAGKDLRAFPADLPGDQINTKIDRTFVPRATVEVPTSRAKLSALRSRLLTELRETTFRAWPERSPLKAVELGDEPASGMYPTEPPIQAAWRYIPGEGRGPVERRARWLIVLNEGESDDVVPRWAASYVREGACVLFSPRGVGATERTIKKPYYFRRSLALLGRTIDSGRVWDVLAFVRGSKRTWKVAGRAQAGVIGAYAALFEGKIKEVVCVDPPASHDGGPYFLSVMRTLDIPDALGLLAPRPLTLRGAVGSTTLSPPRGAKARAFDRTAAYYRAAGAEGKFTRRGGPIRE